MSPRSSAHDAAATRTAIVAEAVALGSVEGLESVSIGRLADRVGMSKAGVIGRFGSKEALQLAALESAIATFTHEVWEPAARTEPGLARLHAIVDAWLSYLERDVFPGGCFLTAAACEWDGRAGPVRAAVEAGLARWQGVLGREAATAIAGGELPADADPRQIAFELGAIAMAVNQGRQLGRDEAAVPRGRRAMRRVLGPPRTPG